MTESAADIIKYLDIVKGKISKDNASEEIHVDLGISTRGADVGNAYTFDNGLCWARIIGEEDSHWLIEHGLLEHAAIDTAYISKYDMTGMLRSGEMVFTVIDEDKDILEEKLQTEEFYFDEFIVKVDRYLLVNENKEVDDFDYNWNDAFRRGLSSVEAVDEAIILED